ncbi:T9SS type A sorting domain-containing protein [Rufibacter roseus]|uniref:T9SS type A sorting domain-containing protein n=1 Tax=Rufibacter roseus TaxID=1567108 RepID=A0ABW2DHQ7_9BACT|nr:T9SS type A sorting domain-containing protein [Rufibacter roseus]
MNRAIKVLAFFTSCLAITAQSVLGQKLIRFQEVQGPEVLVQGQTLPQPWIGGLNSPQFSAIDLNLDGQDDLFVFDRSSQRIITFLAVQRNGQWGYQHAPQFEAAFPTDLRMFALLRDYNNDGDPDIFTATNQGIMVYKNISATVGKLAFDLAYPILYFNTDANLLVGSEDLPAIADMDGDGDLDILTWEWSGGIKLEYFQNQREELGLPSHELKFTKTSNWWGQVTRCVGSCNNYRFNDHCPSSHHIGGSSVLPLDVDGNGVLDIVVGHDDCPDLVSLMNTGTNLLPKITSAQYNLPPDIAGKHFSVFPAAYYLDVTFDGVPDLVVAPNATANSHQNVDLGTSTWFFANTGTAAQPRFESAKQPFLQNQMIDVGEGAAPALGNLLGSGNPDLLIGNTAVLKNNRYAASLALYKNVIISGKPTLQLVESDYLGLSEQLLLNLKPQLIDLNADGATDLVYSAYNQNTTRVELKYLLNQASAGQPAQFTLASAVPMTGVLFFRGDTPYLFDIDQDGTFDLLVGRASGALQYYRNSGSSTAPTWELVSEGLGGIVANGERRRLQIAVSDLNQDNQPNLLTSDDSGQLRLYPNFMENISGTFQAEEDVLWQPFYQKYSPLRLGVGMALATGDFYNSGTPAVLVGTHTGGIRYFQVNSGPLGAKEPSQWSENVQVYPNPAQDFVQLVTEKPAAFTLHNLAGVKVAEGNTKAQKVQQLDTQHLPAGLYLLRFISSNGQTTTHKLVIQR